MRHIAIIKPVITCVDCTGVGCDYADICTEGGYRYMACNFFSDDGRCTNLDVVTKVSERALLRGAEQ